MQDTTDPQEVDNGKILQRAKTKKGNRVESLEEIHLTSQNWHLPLRHGGTLNSRRAASPLVRLVEGEERWEAPGHQGVLPLSWGGTEQNRTVTCMVLKAKANDRRKNSSP
ncbi:uncharacterized protein TNCV_477441 [Trichonephila clavipes]|nr:uncharacterized protein TNCV_477441 [Trichonephila clavipes]